MWTVIVALLVLSCAAVAGDAAANKPGIWVDTYFDNASPLRWELKDETTLDVMPLADHERFSLNQQLTHWNFKVRCTPEFIGKTVTITMGDAMNIWNGKPVPALRPYKLAAAISSDGTNWACVPSENFKEGPVALQFKVKLESACVQVARVVPYTDADLQATIKHIHVHPDVRVQIIGQTVESRPLEIIEVGAEAAPHRVFIRARAHPWETGGSWLLEGLLHYLTSDDADAAKLRQQVCFQLMPMASKDGVYRGMTRFNVSGCDLNRNWFADKPVDAALMPENACLRKWFEARQKDGRLPELAICIHNDNSGGLHLSHPKKDPEGYLARMERLEKLLRERTFCREGAKGKGGSFTNSGSFGEGICELYSIDGLVWELREGFADGLDRAPLHTDWQKLGVDFAKLLREYFAEARK